MIKQKRGNNKRKVIVSLSLVCLLFVAVITAVILINAFPSQAFDSSIKVSYVAKDISAEVSAWYKEETGTKTYLTTTEGGTETVLKLKASGGDTAQELHMDKDITLTSSNKYVIFCYEFKNTGSKTIAADHLFTNTVSGVDPVNLNITYSLDGTNFDNINTGLSLTEDSTKSYYFKIEVKNLAFNSSLEGTINWELNSLKNATTNADGANDPVRIGAISYTTFEEAYTAAQSGDILTINEDLNLAEEINIIKDVTIIAEPKSRSVTAQQISAKSNNGLTIYIDNSFIVYGNLQISSNASYPITITSNTPSIASIVRIATNATLTTRGVNFLPAAGATAQRAAAIYGTFNLYGGEVSNFTQADGGAIFVGEGATFVIAGNANITNCSSSTYGGAIYNMGLTRLGRSTLVWTGSISNNTANLGGGAICNTNTLSQLSGTVENNYCSDFTNAMGGAIINVNSKSVFSMQGGEIKNNGFNGSNTMSFGGAIANSGGFSLMGGKISGNKAKNGGAIFNNSSLSIGSASSSTASTALLENNIASLSGGAIYNTATGTILQKGATFNANQATDAYGTGGAIASLGTATIYHGTYTNNTANLGGGAIYIPADSGMFEISGGTFTNNSAMFGGVVYNSSEDFRLLSGNFSQNTADAGGVLYNDGTIEGDIESSDGVTRLNPILKNNSAINGGAIYSTGELNFSDTICKIEFVNNVAELMGGAIYSSGIFDQWSGTFTGNYCTEQNYSMGGAVYNEGNYFLCHVKFKNNGYNQDSYVAHGGAIYNSGTLELTLESEIMNNAAKEGGAIYNIDTSSILGGADINIEQNYAVSFGGAIYNSGEIALDCVFNNNGYRGEELTQKGGAIYNTNKVEFMNSINCNYNKANYGGAIYCVGENTDISLGAEVFYIGNYAAKEGGAIYLDEAKNVVFASDEFYGNYAGESGGAIMLNYGAIATINDCTFANTDNSGKVYHTGNNAMYGGAIFVSGKTENYNASELIITGGTFDGLSTSVAGGTITNLGICRISENTKINNCFSQIGGAIANALSSLTDFAKLYLSNTTISNCTALAGESNGIANLGEIYLVGQNTINSDIGIIRGMTELGYIKLAQGSIALNGISTHTNQIPISFIDATINDYTNLDFSSLNLDINGTRCKENVTIPSGINWFEFKG